MRHGISLFAVLILISLSAAAQGPVGVGAEGFHAQTHSPLDSSSFPSKWRFSIGYQYTRYNLTGSPFNTTGFNGSASRFFNNWFGLEGEGGFGEGQTGTTTVPANLTVKSLFISGGPRLFRRYGRLEGWVHALGGVQHFRFNQTAGELGSNTGAAALVGAGVDFRFSRDLTFAGEADQLGTRLFGGYERHFQVVTSLTFRY